MYIVRPVTTKDIDGIFGLAQKAFPGMTTLPPDRDALMKKIDLSLKSMLSEVSEASDQTYMLVMEDTNTQQVVGTANIIARLGENDQFYSYKLNKMTYSHKALDKKVSVESLHLSNHFEGFAEVATLYLAEPFRRNGNGKLLAKSRYLFMAKFRERFPEKVMADLRGYFDSDGNSPFWNALGQRFFDMSFAEADLYGSLNGNQFIADLMPKQPVYVNLLPQDAQDAIGRPNDQGKAALAMLENEGFRWNGHIDIFDGSPSVDVLIDQLESVKACQQATCIVLDEHAAKSSPSQNSVSNTPANKTKNTQYLISAGGLFDYRVCASEAVLINRSHSRALLANKEQDYLEIALPLQTRDALHLAQGDVVSFITL